jgi:Tfp pilus assembly protein PilF
MKDEKKIDHSQSFVMQAIDANVNRADAHILLARIYEKKNMMDDAMNQY